MYTIEQLSERTGLSLTIMRKYINRLRPVLEPHIQRGDKNRIFFDNNGIVIFDHIKQYKEQGLTLPDIEKKLKADLEKDVKTDVKTGGENIAQTQGSTGETNVLYEKIFKTQQQLADEKQKRLNDQQESSKRILELEKLSQRLQGELKLLPEGKDPDQVKQDWEEEQKRKREIVQTIAELENTGTLRIKKRRQLIKRLKELQR